MKQNTDWLREMPSSLNDACRKLELAVDRIEVLEAVLNRCRTVLSYMALENEGAIFNSDARNLLPVIDDMLLEKQPAPEHERTKE